MITLTKNGNAIVFTFEDNAHYLFDGTISVPVNSLTLITDNSQMATFKKSASNDVFISATYAELGMSKSELESWFKENACGSTGGGGVTSGEVETMIETSLEDYYDIDEVDTALANKADTSAVTASISAAVSGKADTSAFTAYSAATDARLAEDEEVTAAGLNALNDALGDKADTSAVTASIAAAVSGKQDTLIAGSGITISGNVISSEGGGATYSAGTNISIDSANTINCTIPAYFHSDARKGDIAIGTNITNTHSDYYKVVIGRQIDTYGNSNSSYSVGIAPATNNSSFYSQLKGNNSVGIGKYFQITANQSVAIGSEANSSVAGGVAIGYQANATGTTKMNLNNQIKVDTNNQIYIKDKTNTTDVCIQDAIAALGGLKFVQCTQAEYDALVSGGTVDSSTIYFITNVVS